MPCHTCGKPTKRAFTGKANSVVEDSIPGGVVVENGPIGKYYSKSEMHRAAAEQGWTNYVVHSPAPGTDKSKHTVRWTSVDLTDYSDPQVIAQREADMAAHCGVTVEEYRRRLALPIERPLSGHNDLHMQIKAALHR
jgi:hypothetical protein